MNCRYIGLLAFALFGIVGCKESKATPTLTEVEMIVTINGAALPHALVTLTPTDSTFGGNAIASGVTDEAGKVKFQIAGKPGAAVGQNKVTVADPPPPDELRGESPEAQAKLDAYHRSLKNRPIPPKYGVLIQSDATVEIKKDQKDYKLDLKR